jgi:HEAT repeat protein
MEALRDEYWDVRECAAELLAKAGPAAVPALARALADSDYFSRWYAARTLARIGPEARAALPDLGRALGDPAMDVRKEAAEAIVRMGDPGPAAPRLVAALADPSEPVRALAAEALGGTGAAVLSEIIKVVEHGGPEAQRAAIEALSRIGPPARPAAAVLMGALRDEIARTERQAAAIENIGIRDSFMRHHVPEQAVSRALGRMGPAVVPPLLEMVNSQEYVKAWFACDILGRMGPEAASATPGLVKALREARENGHRVRVALTLGSVGAGSAEAVAALKEGLAAEDDTVRRLSAVALGRAGGAAALAEALRDPQPKTRKAAAAALRGMGKDARSATDALRAAARDADPEVAAEAAAALQAIQSAP